MKHGLDGLLVSSIHNNFFITQFVIVLFIKLLNMYVTVLYSYKKYCRIVRFSNENAMMHALNYR